MKKCFELRLLKFGEILSVGLVENDGFWSKNQKCRRTGFNVRFLEREEGTLALYSFRSRGQLRTEHKALIHVTDNCAHYG